MFFRKAKNYKTLNDDDLLLAYKRTEDIHAAAELYLRYRDMIYGTCMKYLKNSEDAKDASMELFEQLREKWLRFDIEHIKSWTYAVVRNHCLMQLRNSQRHQQNFLTEKETAELMELPDSLHPMEEREITFMQLESAIEDLDENQSLCIRLFYLQEYSYKSIVEQTGLDLKQVKSYIQNGKRQLSIRMKKLE